MILTPNFGAIPEERQALALRRLLDREPYTLHSVAQCWNKECTSCNQWKAWARQVRELHAQIEATNKKA